jgi:protein-L-isoaspartate(D-aspartate) O-methyltransferase
MALNRRRLSGILARWAGAACSFAGLAIAGIAMTAQAQTEPAAQRAQMVAEIEAMYAETAFETGVASMSTAVRAAMGTVERHRLLSPDQAPYAYRNHPLPIGAGQTISQPYIVAISTDLVDPKPGDVVLEVGTGSGYQAAVLAEIVSQVYTIEIVESLARRAQERLAALGYRNIEVRIGDGYLGWPEHAPFDGIVVTAAAPSIPPALVEQLKPGGRMAIPVGGEGEVQFLMLVTKLADGRIEQRRVLPVRFVPLVPGR